MMKNSSALSCEHIRIRRAPGRTDGFIDALQRYLKSLFTQNDKLSWVEVRIADDDRSYCFEWQDGGLCGDGADEALTGMAGANRIDVRVDMCCEFFHMEDAQSALTDVLRDGQLKDCVRYVALLQDESSSALMLSGLYRGSFLHGAVPFTADNQDILVVCKWNGFTHRAEFRFPESAVNAAAALADELEDRLEIELTLADDGRSLTIESLQLADRREVFFYRDALEQLARLSERAQITGALAPDSDSVFALLRFVQEGSGVIWQAAVAEY